MKKIIKYSAVGLIVYYVTKCFFPEKRLLKKALTRSKDPKIDTRGGDLKIRSILREVVKNRALKISLIAVFGTAMADQLKEELHDLLLHATYSNLVNVTEIPEISYLISVANQLNVTNFDEPIRSLLLRTDLDNGVKVALLKIKIETILNGDLPGKKRFFLMVLIALIVSISFSGVGGIAIFLEALRKLLEEGKISKALYKKILRLLLRKHGRGILVPSEGDFF